MNWAEYWYYQGLQQFYQGQYQQALQALEKACQAEPQRIDFLNSLGIIRRVNGDLQGALSCFERLVQAQPEHPDYQTNYAHVLLELGRTRAALERYQQVVRQFPQMGWCWLNLGKALYQAHMWTVSYQSFLQAVYRGAGPEAAYWLGLLDFRDGLYHKAEKWLKTAFKGGFIQAFDTLAEIYRQSRQWEKAENLYQKLNIKHKNAPKVLFRRVQILIEQARFAEAQKILQNLLEAQPDWLEAQILQAWLWQKQGNTEMAYQALLNLANHFPSSASVWLHLGNLHFEQGNFDAAEQYFKRALACDPTCVRAWVNLGLLALEQKQPEQCLDFQKRALHLEPGNAWARLHQAHALFLLGRYSEAWEVYEARLNLLPLHFPCSIWQGESLKNLHLLVICEQGFGDSLQFIRFLPVLWRHYEKPRLTLCCQVPLVKLFRQALEGIAEIRTLDEQAEIVADRCIALLSLPRYLHIEPNQLYSEPYLTYPREALSSTLMDYLKPEKIHIGLVWSAADGHDTQAKRSLSFSQLLVLIHTFPECNFVSLQLGSARQQLIQAQVTEVIDAAPWLTDFAATASLLAHLDLLISVDTAVAHLAGALGKTAWILLPWASDWRWGLDGEQTPWYPCLRLFRQSQRGDWSSVLTDLEKALARWLKTYRKSF